MADYNINGTLFFNVALQHKGGPRARTQLAESFLRLIDPLSNLDERQTLIWRERLKNSRALARSGVVHALAVQPGRIAARIENPLTHAMHSVKIGAPAASEAVWDAVATQAGREAQAAAQIANGALPDSLLPNLLLTRGDVNHEADGATMPLDQPPDALMTTAWLVFAERIDADPWLWMLFRDQTRDGLLALIRQHARERAVQTSSGESFIFDRFWTMGVLPARDAEQPEARVLSQLAASPCSIRIGRRSLATVLKRAMT